MKNRRRTSSGDPMFNPKRTLRPFDASDRAATQALAGKVRYRGNPAHKRDPGDFDLTPASAPRPNATLCDEAGVATRSEAQDLLREGVLAGLVDARTQNGFPRLVWTVRKDGTVFEAQLENSGLGEYHGYPLPLADPFREVVLDEMRRR